MSEVQPEAPVVEPEAEEWQGVSQEDWQAQQEVLQQAQEQLAALAPLAEIAQQLPPEGYQEPQPQAPTLDPFSDDFGNQLAQFVQQQMAPVSEYTMQAQLDESEQRAQDIIGSVAQQAEYELPEGGANWIRARAEDFVEDAMARHGAGPQAAEAAIESAFTEYKTMLEEAGKAYYEQQMNQLQTLSGAPRQPEAVSASVQNLAAPTGGPQAVLKKYFG